MLSKVVGESCQNLVVKKSFSFYFFSPCLYLEK